MSAAFSPAEIAYLVAWAREDNAGLANGSARILLRQHGIHPAVMGQLFARFSTLSGRSQFELVDGPASNNSVSWPWATLNMFETRLQELLPESTVHYLEVLGVLPVSAMMSHAS